VGILGPGWSSLRAQRKNLVQVPTPVYHTDDLGDILRDAVKDDVGARGDGSQSRPDLGSGSPGEGMIFEQEACLVDVADDLVGRVPAGDVPVIVPDFPRDQRARRTTR
jgi:hypothetical protein